MEHRAIDVAAEADIREQPEVLARFLDEEMHNAERIGARLERARIDYVLVAGRGSSDNATRYAQYLFGAERRMPVAQATPSLFTRYGAPPRLDGALVIAVSQSGASSDVVEVIAEARRQGRPTVGITNTPGSALADAAEHVLHLHAGYEQSGIATKTFVASLGAFALLSAAISGDDALRGDLAALPDALERALVLASKSVGDVAEAMAGALHATVIGRGFNFATALETALKLTSLTRTSAMAYSAADAIRGPMASVAGSSPVVLVAPTGRVLSDVVDLIPELRARQVPLVTVSDVPDVLREGDHALPLPDGVREWVSPLVAVIPGQLLAVEVARRQAALACADPSAVPAITDVSERGSAPDPTAAT